MCLQNPQHTINMFLKKVRQRYDFSSKNFRNFKKLEFSFQNNLFRRNTIVHQGHIIRLKEFLTGSQQNGISND